MFLKFHFTLIVVVAKFKLGLDC